MKKETKRKIIFSVLTGLGIVGICFLINKNRKQAGIILNQQLTIDGLMREVKNLSYHLGKRH